MSKKSDITFFLFIIIGILVLTVSCSKTANWPQFRGPESNMLPAGKNLPEEWGVDKNIKWVAELDGAGYSSPVVWGNKVFITSAFPEKVNPAPERGPGQGPPPQGGQGPQPGQRPQQGPQPGQMTQPGQGAQPGQTPRSGQSLQTGQGPQPGPQPPQQEVIDTSFKNEIYQWEIICLDLNTGKEIWKQTAYHGSPKTGKNPNSTYACETPLTDGIRVYAYFGTHGLYCYDMEGKLLWEKDMGVYYTQRGWGTGSSPVLYKNTLYIQRDNEENSFLIALDAITGEEKWKVQRDEKTTYSTPYIWKNKIRTELVTCGKTARSYDPENGKLLWQFQAGGEQVIPSPVGNEELLFLGNSGGRQVNPELFAVKAGFDGDITNTGVAWKSAEAGLGNPSPLLYKGLLYIIGSRGEIAVLDAATGEIKYQKRISGIGNCWASPWAYKDKIYFLDENGSTRIFPAGEPVDQLSENKLEGKFWPSVAITGDAYIFKGAGRLICVKE